MIINHIIKQTGNFAICISAYDLSYLQKKMKTQAWAVSKMNNLVISLLQF